MSRVGERRREPRRIAILAACVVTLLCAGRAAAQAKPKRPLGLDADSTYVPDDNPMPPVLPQ